MLPSINGVLVRLFQYHGEWYIADNHSLQLLASHEPAPSAIAYQFQMCLQVHYTHGLARFARDLEQRGNRVWFFGMFPHRPSLLFLGSCNFMANVSVAEDLMRDTPLNLDYRVDSYPVPHVPTISQNLQDLRLDEPLFDPRTLLYTSLYDGIFVVNPVSLFAVRLCLPDVVYLTPLLEHRFRLDEFLALRETETQLINFNRSGVDHNSRQWWTETLRETGERMFKDKHEGLIASIQWQVAAVMQWLPTWMVYVSTLTWDEWNSMDRDLQRLYVLLDYEQQHCWHYIIGNPKYEMCVAKAVVFCLDNWSA